MTRVSAAVLTGLSVMLIGLGDGRAEESEAPPAAHRVRHSAPALMAEAPPSTTQRTVERLHFNVPPDWPIEKRGGVMAPIPIEEYLGKKFQAIETTLQQMEQRLNGFDLRLRAVEEQVKKERSGLRSSESPGLP